MLSRRAFFGALGALLPGAWLARKACAREVRAVEPLYFVGSDGMYQMPAFVNEGYPGEWRALMDAEPGEVTLVELMRDPRLEALERMMGKVKWDPPAGAR